MKKSVKTLFLAAAAVSLLAGCSGSSNSGSAPQNSQTADTQTSSAASEGGTSADAGGSGNTGKTDTGSQSPADKKSYTIGIGQFAAHGQLPRGISFGSGGGRHRGR